MRVLCSYIRKGHTMLVNVVAYRIFKPYTSKGKSSQVRTFDMIKTSIYTHMLEVHVHNYCVVAVVSAICFIAIALQIGQMSPNIA